MSDSSVFIVSYRDPEKPNEMIEVRVRNVDDSALGPAFIALSDFVFGTSTGLINPRDEYAKKRFVKTKTLHLSIYNVVTIEEVGDENPGLKLAPKEGVVLPFKPENN